jgi:hypothetical protein
MLRLSQWFPAWCYSQSGTRIGTFGLASYTQAITEGHSGKTPGTNDTTDRSLQGWILKERLGPNRWRQPWDTGTPDKR